MYTKFFFSSSFGGGGGGGPSFGGRGGGNNNNGPIGSNLKTISWDLSRLPVFEKNFYIEHPIVTKRPDIEAQEWRRKNEISVVGRGVPKVIIYFSV